MPSDEAGLLQPKPNAGRTRGRNAPDSSQHDLRRCSFDEASVVATGTIAQPVSATSILSIDVDSLIADTRPFRGGAPVAYAGCMTVALAAPIDRVYSSGFSYRQDLWLRRELLKNEGILVSWSQEAGHGLGNTPTKVTKNARSDGRSTREHRPRFHNSRSEGILVAIPTPAWRRERA